MDSNAVSEGIELVARGLEVLGVAVIGVAFVYGLFVASCTSSSGIQTPISD
jgi:hypothetical protein